MNKEYPLVVIVAICAGAVLAQSNDSQGAQTPNTTRSINLAIDYARSGLLTEAKQVLIPLLHETMLHAGTHGVEEVVMGMAHRGRLNVLVNILGKSPEMLFAEFEGNLGEQNPLHSGDVKYHLGFASDIQTPGGPLHMAMAFNPSHLEIVDPVVLGSARARQIRRKDHQHDKVMPILIHGDASFSGQGVIMELFQMSETRGFAVGGTLHIVVNNQIGFTTSNPDDMRSTLYCTTVAKWSMRPYST